MWHEGLEEASGLYFGQHNIPSMFAVLEPLHVMLARGPETLREISFNQAFGRDLQEAMEWGKKYKITGIENDLHQAWDLYYHVSIFEQCLIILMSRFSAGLISSYRS
jgi:FKBP12-rapamycin complex-associated protein